MQWDKSLSVDRGQLRCLIRYPWFQRNGC